VEHVGAPADPPADALDDGGEPVHVRAIGLAIEPCGRPSPRSGRYSANSATLRRRLSMLLPRQAVPALRVPTLAHGDFVLADDAPARFTLLVFYRGLHCPICLKYLLELGRLLPEFDRRGVKVVALSSDVRERAQAMADKLEAPDLRLGYGMPLAEARAWGLYISSSRGKTSIGIEEPALFSEPGVFIVRPDGTLYYGAVQTMPFARPHFDELLGAIDFAVAKDYPARGEYTGPV
jgi:peroxiredoxin